MAINSKDSLLGSLYDSLCNTFDAAKEVCDHRDARIVTSFKAMVRSVKQVFRKEN